MNCWLENQLVGLGFFRIAGHLNNHPWKDEIVSLDQKEEDQFGFFSMFWFQVTKPSPNLKVGKIETLKLKKENGVKTSRPPFQRIIQRGFSKVSQWTNKLLDEPFEWLYQRWFWKDSQWMNKLLDDANAMEVYPILVCDTSFGCNGNLWNLGQSLSLDECKWMWWNVMQVSPILCYNRFFFVVIFIQLLIYFLDEI